jgi:hypothetical protein
MIPATTPTGYHLMHQLLLIPTTFFTLDAVVIPYPDLRRRPQLLIYLLYLSVYSIFDAF